MPKELEVAHNFTGEMWDWPLNHNEISRVHNDKDGFEVHLDCPFFTPKEIKVTALDNNALTVDCLHEERNDKFGTIKREVHRCYHLPDDCDKASLKSELTPKGQLVIKCNKKK